ncbi:autotransporter domain-containing protein, partial [Paraburkholderia aspalathi]|nr:autotransporter domain-containing protein [Paraburkholderia aspalathi]
VSLRTDGYTEHGGAAALHSGSQTTDSTFTTLGLRASTGFMLGTMSATARGTVGWRHAYGDTTPLATHSFASGDAFTVAGVPIAGDSAILEAGFDLNLTEAATLGISYSGQLASRAHDHGFKAILTVKF